MNTMFEKVAVAGDITQAIDRRGCWSVAITVIGGASNTAVKLQSCDTADGSFTDYAELIPASESTADQYKGFVLDLYGAKKFIKVTGATMATAVLGDCDHDIKSVAITAGEVPSGADLENNKTATINVSEYTQPVEITPSEGKDGMKKATVTLSNIPSPSGVTTLYAWKDTEDFIVYLPVSIAPSTKADVMYIESSIAVETSIRNLNTELHNAIETLGEEDTYTRISDTEFSMHLTNSDITVTLTRYSDGDVALTVW